MDAQPKSRSPTSGDTATASQEEFDAELANWTMMLKDDPVETLLDGMTELSCRVQARLKDQAGSTGQVMPKLYVFIDDLDRCLPDVQVQVLKNLHFLTRSGGDFVFLVALDARLLESSLKIHYGSKGLDANGYIQKLFHLRAPLSRARAGGTKQASTDIVKRYVPADAVEIPDLSRVFTKALPSLSPRTLERVAARAWLAAGCDASTFVAHISARFFVAH